jgi:hypothetical protein
MASQIVIGKNQAAKPRAKTSSLLASKQPSSPVTKDPMTLARLVTEAVSDVRALLKSDPHLRLLLKDLSLEAEDIERASREVDGYISAMVAAYLSNKRRKPRVRFPKVFTLSTANLKDGTARCVVRISAWGETQRIALDLELPK